jgi:molybdopterin converting factor small subunit
VSVTFLPFGILKSFTNGAERLVLEGKEGQSLESVCQEIGLPVNLIALFLVNGERRSKDYLLQANDEVKLIALVGGG